MCVDSMDGVRLIPDEVKRCCVIRVRCVDHHAALILPRNEMNTCLFGHLDTLGGRISTRISKRWNHPISEKETTWPSEFMTVDLETYPHPETGEEVVYAGILTRSNPWYDQEDRSKEPEEKLDYHITVSQARFQHSLRGSNLSLIHISEPTRPY